MLDLETTKRLAQEVIRTQGPDFVYNPDGSMGTCAYVPQFHPHFNFKGPGWKLAKGSEVTGCIVGEIIERDGQMTPAIARTSLGARFLFEDGFVDATPEAVIALRRMQVAQDNMATWGEAYAAAFGEVFPG